MARPSEETGAERTRRSRCQSSTLLAPGASTESGSVGVNVDFVGPTQTTSDQVKLKGELALKGAKVKVNGKPATVHGRHWSFVVAINHKGDNRYNVVASKSGHLKEKTWDPEGVLSTIPAISTALFGVLTG